MVDQRIKNLSGNSRRSFLKFASAVGAGLAVSRTDVLNFIADTGGHAMADECVGRNRMVSLIGGNGGFAWFQLLWPHNDVATATAASLFTRSAKPRTRRTRTAPKCGHPKHRGRRLASAAA